MMRTLMLGAFLATAIVIAPAPSTVSATGSSTLPVWIGAPFIGSYGGTGGRGGYPPHNPYSGNWAMDLFRTSAKTVADVTSTNVYVYAKPKYPDKATITAKVVSVKNSSCGAGKNIRVEIFNEGVSVGWISYTHVKSSFAIGYTGPISTWGGKLGTIWYGTPTDDSCWQVNYVTSGHVHIEARNTVGTSCYRKLDPGSTVARGEFIGYIGRNDSGACDPGA
jgi:hypothetical protein